MSITPKRLVFVKVIPFWKNCDSNPTAVRTLMCKKERHLSFRKSVLFP